LLLSATLTSEATWVIRRHGALWTWWKRHFGIAIGVGAGSVTRSCDGTCQIALQLIKNVYVVTSESVIATSNRNRLFQRHAKARTAHAARPARLVVKREPLDDSLLAAALEPRELVGAAELTWMPDPGGTTELGASSEDDVNLNTTLGSAMFGLKIRDGPSCACCHGRRSGGCGIPRPSAGCTGSFGTFGNRDLSRVAVAA
jgi:hypothetical protein